NHRERNALTRPNDMEGVTHMRTLFTHTSVTRRDALRLLGVSAAAGLLAACGGTQAASAPAQPATSSAVGGSPVTRAPAGASQAPAAASGQPAIRSGGTLRQGALGD